MNDNPIDLQILAFCSVVLDQYRMAGVTGVYLSILRAVPSTKPIR